MHHPFVIYSCPIVLDGYPPPIELNKPVVLGGNPPPTWHPLNLRLATCPVMMCVPYSACHKRRVTDALPSGVEPNWSSDRTAVWVPLNAVQVCIQRRHSVSLTH